MKKRISEEEVKNLYLQYGTPEHVIGHCRAVSFVAVKLAEELNKHGYSFDLSLVRGAGLAHDVARTCDDHGGVCADELEALGYCDEAGIVRFHMYYDIVRHASELTECDLVCLADKLVKEDKYVGLIPRMEYLIAKMPADPAREARIKARWAELARLIEEIENITDRTIDSLFTDEENQLMNNMNKLDQLLKRVEKPGRYIGGEVHSVVKDPAEVDANFAFAFPDMYEIGMSYLGLQILYHQLNSRENIYCQRVFAPAVDMETLLREENMPLMTLESKTPLKDCDFLGFTLQYEMSYTTVLNMIDLAQIPLYAKDRGEEYPLICAGGPCAYNPEPLADFVDFFVIGDGEEALPSVVEKYIECKKAGMNREEFLREACKMEGIYVPKFYEVEYNEDGTINKLCKLYEGAPDRVQRAMISEIESVDFPVKPIIPMVEAVHDRSIVETFRGCTRGCRFCQAGMIYRPVRERSKDKILDLCRQSLENTGNDELSLLSLSTSDHSEFESFAMELIDYTKSENVSLSLPSLRIDKFAFEVLNKIQEFKKSGLTYAPEAGSQRLRDVINKGVTEEDILTSIEQALELGWQHIKLYFMIGLPTETYEDLDGIADLARKIMDINFKVNGRAGGRFRLTVSVSNFVPKADTPFQWAAQNTAEEFAEKHAYLIQKLKIKGVTFNYHDNTTSSYEAVFARGDRRTGKLLYEAHKAGCKFDGWSEHFKPEAWEKAFETSGIDRSFYTTRERSFDEVLPWDIVDCSVSKKFLINEAKKALAEQTTQDCRHGCVGCGINRRVKCQMDGILGGKNE